MRSISRDIQILCLNTIHGRESWLYHELSVERIKEIYTTLVEAEYRKSMSISDSLMALPIEQKRTLLEELRNRFNINKRGN